jgi:peptide/nickel transport system substrate-binding protein
MRPRVVLAAVAAVAVTAALGACTKNTGSSGETGTGSTQSGAISTNPKDSQGPAPAVRGAKRGGTVYQLLESDYDHLDPTRAYVNNATAVTNLLVRTLTMFSDRGNGKLLLVGDLATDAGDDISGGKCTKWRFTLKKGLRYQDGSTVTAADVAYGVARSFSPNLAEGPHYIQQWLANSIDYNKTYQGPYNGGSAIPPGVTVNGRNITFSFRQPHCDMPFAASWGTTAPLPRSRDSDPQKIDLHPFSSGPYQVQSYLRDNKLVLVRNKYWSAATDAVRHNYFSRFIAEFGETAEQQANAIKADQGTDTYSIMGANVPPSLLPTVQGDPSVASRVASGFTQFVWYLSINNQRVTSLSERRALNYAFNKRAFLQALGGSTAGVVANTLLSPTTIGYRDYNAYPYSPSRAKKLLNGRKPRLVFAFPNTARWQTLSVTVQNTLQQAGFSITTKPIDSASYYSQIGMKNNPYDLYFAGWGSDWPSGLTIIPPVFDGRNIAAQGNSTYPYFNSDAVNARIDTLQKESANKAAPGWAALDKTIMTDYAPVVPVWYDRAYQLHGSKLGNVKIGQSTGWPIYYNVYVK